MILSREKEDWPLWVMQWACESEIFSDVDLYDRVSAYGGLSLNGLKAGENLEVNLMFSFAESPLPEKHDLPNGEFQFIQVTVITDDEVQFCMENGCEALMAIFKEKGVELISDLNRPSVLID